MNMIYSVHMGLHIAAWILISWLLTIAWLDSSRLHYALWAGVVATLWWVAWIRRNPPWPARREQRILIYVTFLSAIFILAFFIDRWQGYFVFFVLILLWFGERLMKRRQAA